MTVAPNRGYQLKHLTYAAATKTVADILPDDFPKMANELDEPADGYWKASGENSTTGESWEKQCYLTLDGNSLRFFFLNDRKDISKNASVSQVGENYVYTDGTVTITFNMSEKVLRSIEFAGIDTWNGTYSPVSQCIAAGTMISMPEGRQKAI